MIPFEYIRTGSAKAAIDAIGKTSGAQFIAGGTNLVDLMKRGVTAPPRLIDINGLPLKEIRTINGGIQIGALALNADVAMHETIQQQYPLLAQALRAGASPQLRNMATVGGNMMQRTRCTYFYDTVMPCNKRQAGSGCGALKGYNRMHAIFGASDQCIAVHPSDMCVALAALNATVLVSHAKGERKILFTDFHRLPGTDPGKDNTLQKGELITGVVLPANKLQQHAYYLKIRDRASYAFALVSVAAAFELSGQAIRDVRLAMGGVAHKPWRLTEAENYLKGKTATVANFRQAGVLAVKGAKSYGHNDFKIKLVPAAVEEALTKALG